MGVITPKAEILDILNAYKDPEKRNIPVIMATAEVFSA